MPRWNSFSMLKWRERRELFRVPEKCGRISEIAQSSRGQLHRRVSSTLSFVPC